MLEVIADVLMLIGAAVFVLAGIGLLRLPDMFTRISAVGTAGGVGTAAIVLGVALQDPSWLNLGKGGIAIALQLMTSAVGAIMIARAAVLAGHYFASSTDVSDAVRLGVLGRTEPVATVHEDDD